MDTPSTPPPPTVSTPPPTKHRSYSLWRLVIGLPVIFIGLQFLAMNFGWNWTWTENIWQLWPLLIVLFGILLITRGHGVPRWVGYVLALLVITAGVLWAVTRPAVNHEAQTTTIRVPYGETITTARYFVTSGASTVTIRGGADDLVNGSFMSNSGRTVNVTSTENAGETTVRLTPDSAHEWWFFPSMRNTIDLRLRDGLTSTVTVDAGASKIDADLRTVPVTDVEFKAGASTMAVTLGDAVAQAHLTIDAGASTMTIRVPLTVGIELRLDAGATTKHFSSDLKKIDDDRYETDGYATAAKKVSIDIDAGASTITIIHE